MTQAATNVTICDTAKATDRAIPLEYALLVMNISGSIERDRLLTTKDPVTPEKLQFEKGWDAGLNYDLDTDSVPVMAPVEMFLNEIRAWVLGFVAGQYASACDMVSPFCNHSPEDHN